MAYKSIRKQNNLSSYGVPLPARSPDLSPLDYFLWGYVKENVFKRQSADIEILKEIVQEVVSSIDQDVLRGFMANIEKRIILCTEQQGGISNICYKLKKVTICSFVWFLFHISKLSSF